MKPAHFLLYFPLLVVLSGGCKKTTDDTASTVFFRVFPNDTSYYTGGAFQTPDGNFVVYGFPPENNELPPLLIKCDLHGSIIWKKSLPPDFHYCTIKPNADGSMTAVGVLGSDAFTINVCEIDTDGKMIGGTWRDYPMENIRSGSVIPPKFEKMATGDLLIAGTTLQDNYLFPFVLHVDASGNANPPQVFNFNVPGVTSLMARGISRDNEGFTITGSTYKTNILDTTPLVSFCLRLNTAYEELWHTILTFPEGSITSKGVIETESSILLYGSNKTGSYNNSAINDMPGTLYTQQIDKSGNVVKLVPYSAYPNMAHAAELVKTDDGFIMAATTNELLDIHLLSDNHIYLLKLDDSLQEVWHHEFDGFNAFTAVSVFPTIDGGYLIGGYAHSGTFLYNMCLIKTDANGNIVLE